MLEQVLVVLLCALMGALAYWRGLLTPMGSLAAMAIGMVIGIFGGLVWVLILLVFFLSSFAATRYRFEAKKALGLQEGRRGERGATNVIANGAVACAAAIAHPFMGSAAAILFLVAVGAAASDTIASELGILSPRAYLITTFRRVAPGTNGGISLAGTLWALFAAVYVALVGNMAFFLAGIFHPDSLSITLPVICGFMGCQIDSLLGATLEARGLLTKQTNNLYSVALVTLMAAVVLRCLS
ncbi:MAG: DUF92 domain-containing protein [Candidatus Thermoplasmatota archaeon]